MTDTCLIYREIYFHSAFVLNILIVLVEFLELLPLLQNIPAFGSAFMTPTRTKLKKGRQVRLHFYLDAMN